MEMIGLVVSVAVLGVGTILECWVLIWRKM